MVLNKICIILITFTYFILFFHTYTKIFHFPYVACIIFPLYNTGLVLSIC